MPLNMEVLLVDDSETMLFQLFSFLTENGCRVQTAKDGSQATQRLNTFRPDLIISDFNMPGMDGFTMLKTLQGDAEAGSIPIFVLTGKSMNASTRQMIELEPNVKRVFHKPLNNTILLEAIKNLAKGLGKYAE